MIGDNKTMKAKCKMKVKELTVARLFNRGDYEHERIEVKVEIGENENPGNALTVLRTVLGKLRPIPERIITEAEEARRWLSLDKTTKIKEKSRIYCDEDNETNAELNEDAVALEDVECRKTLEEYQKLCSQHHTASVELNIMK